MSDSNTKVVNIAVFVSGGGTNLQALIDAQNAGYIPSGKIALVVSNNKNAYALCRAQQYGIPVFSVGRKNPDFEKLILQKLNEYNVDMIVLAGFLCILSADFVSRFKDRIINVHPSLIPDFCGDGYYGIKVHEAVIAAQRKTTGATVHYVNEITDGGQIILQRRVAVLPDDTPQILQQRVMEQAEWVILPLATEYVAKLISQKKK